MKKVQWQPTARERSHSNQQPSFCIVHNNPWSFWIFTIKCWYKWMNEPLYVSHVCVVEDMSIAITSCVLSGLQGIHSCSASWSTAILPWPVHQRNRWHANPAAFERERLPSQGHRGLPQREFGVSPIYYCATITPVLACTDSIRQSRPLYSLNSSGSCSQRDCAVGHLVEHDQGPFIWRLTDDNT